MVLGAGRKVQRFTVSIVGSAWITGCFWNWRGYMTHVIVGRVLLSVFNLGNTTLSDLVISDHKRRVAFVGDTLHRNPRYSLMLASDHIQEASRHTPYRYRIARANVRTDGPLPPADSKGKSHKRESTISTTETREKESQRIAQ